MIYLLDVFATPPVMVVMMTDDAASASDVGQRYATQVGRPIVLCTGPAPVDAQFQPVIPSLPAPLAEQPPSNPAHSVPVSKVRTVTYDESTITDQQRGVLAGLGLIK